MTRLLRAPVVVDTGLLLALGTLALFGFRDTYDGYSYLVSGVTGLVLGVALATLTRQLGQPPIVLLAGIVGAFFLLGGLVALHGLGGTNLLPVPHTLQQLADCVIHGWKQLLTTLPPVDGGPLLALPYLLGLVAGAAGVALAPMRWAPAPVLVPLLLLALVILLGVKDLTLTAGTAAVFAALTIGWLVVRARRHRIRVIAVGSRRVVRRATSVILCGGVAAVALVAGPHLPGLKGHRVVLRSQITPPFDVGQYASPLASFRRFTKGYQTTATSGDALYDKPVLRVSRSLVGTRLRIAALDSYDGNVWGAGDVAGTAVDPETTADDTFQKVGRRIDNPAAGRTVSGTVTILDGDARPGSSSMNVWLPTVGSLAGITFHSPDEEQGSDQFRYNLSTSTGVLPGGLAKGTSYSFQAVVPDESLTHRTLLASGGLPEVDSSTFQQLATTWAGKAATPIGQVDAVAAYLRTHGHYTDGEKGFEFFPAGDSLYRLQYFTSTRGELAGNDEQFAAMMALAANALGVPARVVVGAVPEKDGLVQGQDIHAWVELQAADGSWRTLPTQRFMNRHRKPRHEQEKDQQSIPASNIPPPAPVHPPATAGAPLDNSLNHRVVAVRTHRFALPRFIWALLEYVLLPLLLLVLVFGSVVGAKRWRRHRRRTRGSPSHQLAMAWQELLDHVRDHGVAVATKTTRREQAQALAARPLGLPDLTASARRADSVMFGRDEPSPTIVNEYWAEVDDLRHQISALRTRWQRIRASLNLITFRPRSAPLSDRVRARGTARRHRPTQKAWGT
jgi:hypothetical protein